MKISQRLIKIGEDAKQAASLLRLVKTRDKNEALLAIADALEKKESEILNANRKDLKAAQQNGMSLALLDRLSLEGRLLAIITDVRQVVHLPDPVGEILEERSLPSGLKLKKKRIAIGVLGVIYEARPNVTIDIAALSLKTGNAAILRGGSETILTNRVLIDVIESALKKTSLPPKSIQLIRNPNRNQVKQLLKMDTFVDMIIPRGGEGLHHFCREHSTIPVITGGVGICHLYVDQSAEFEKAADVIVNAKTQRPSVCNALDTLLVHHAIASEFLPLVVEKLLKKAVSFRLDSTAWSILKDAINKDPAPFHKALEADWKKEWLSLILGIKIVDSLEDALSHINSYSSGHSDGILTNNSLHAEIFVEAVDSAAVYVNASTRFTDGGEFGLGAEVAVSTQKLHARGPMGLKELTTYKWILEGNYQVRGG